MCGQAQLQVFLLFRGVVHGARAVRVLTVPAPLPRTPTVLTSMCPTQLLGHIGGVSNRLRSHGSRPAVRRSTSAKSGDESAVGCHRPVCHDGTLCCLCRHRLHVCSIVTHVVPCFVPVPGVAGQLAGVPLGGHEPQHHHQRNVQEDVVCGPVPWREPLFARLSSQLGQLVVLADAS